MQISAAIFMARGLSLTNRITNPGSGFEPYGTERLEGEPGTGAILFQMTTNHLPKSNGCGSKFCLDCRWETFYILLIVV